LRGSLAEGNERKVNVEISIRKFPRGERFKKEGKRLEDKG
jgi:hypothetical protein